MSCRDIPGRRSRLPRYVHGPFLGTAYFDQDRKLVPNRNCSFHVNPWSFWMYFDVLSNRLSKFLFVVLAIALFHAGSESYGQERGSLADKHAPASLMGDHVHEQGEFMVEYRYMNMFMDGNRFGSRLISDQEALTIGQSLGTNFGATPTSMTMEMHMVHIMYGLTDDVTIFAMPQLTTLSMDHIRGPANPAPAGPGFSIHNEQLRPGRYRVWCSLPIVRR